MEEKLATKEKLARALIERKGSAYDPRVDAMIKKARLGLYDDFESELETPIMHLVSDLKIVGYEDLAERAMNGEFDSTYEEAEAWMIREGAELLRNFPAKDLDELLKKYPID
jgi:hypothetical protein